MIVTAIYFRTREIPPNLRPCPLPFIAYLFVFCNQTIFFSELFSLWETEHLDLDSDEKYINKP